MKFKLFILFVVSLELSVNADSNSTDIIYIMPDELIQIAKQNGCKQIDDFYDRPAIWGPVFVSGTIGNPEAAVRVFWCENLETTEVKRFSLIIHPQGDTDSSCGQAKLYWWNYPGGLKIQSLSEYGHSEFRDISDYKLVEIDEDNSGNVIVGEYDGVISVFYCDNGKWRYKTYH